MQIIDFEPTGHGPSLLLADDGSIRRQPLEAGIQLAYRLDRRRCAGTIDDDSHRPCTNPAAPRCPTHTETWICARCTGTCLKEEMDCFDEHAIYLAGFPPSTIKVGVTRGHRLKTRLIEQGATRAAHIETVSNGRIAREIEAELTDRFPDRVRIETKIDGLHERVDPAAWEEALETVTVIDEMEFSYGFDLAQRPVMETMAIGRIKGVQGRILLLDRGATTYAVDLRDLVGYHVVDTPTDDVPSRQRQSALTAFEDTQSQLST